MCAHTLDRSIEDLLGPAENRFFGNGFRAVEYIRGPLTVRDDADHCTTVDSVVGVQYPGDWSVKKPTTGLKPHFSTLDGLILGAELAEASLASAEDPTRLSGARIRRVQIRAGGQPQEDLGHISATAVRRATAPSSTIGDPTSSTVDCKLGGMRVRFDIDHDPVVRPAGSTTYSHPEQVLGSAKTRYYGDGFKTRTQQIIDVAIGDDGRHADATLLVDDNGHSPSAGIGAGTAPTPSPVDIFVTALQTAQVLLYDLDDMSRADSNTLWMRRTTITAGPHREQREQDGVTVSTRLDNCELLDKDDQLWRTADIVATAADMELTCSVTHQLPERGGDQR